MTNLPAALLLDRGGPRRTALLGACLLLVGSVLATVASGQASLLPARGLQGSGVALLASAGLLSLLRARPAGGAAMTAFNVATGVGGSAGLMTGGVLTSELGWRAVFALSALLSLGLLLGSSLARATSAPGPIRDAAVHPAGETLFAALGWRALVGALLANLLVFSNYSVWVVALPLYVAERFDASAERIATLLLVVNVVHLLAAIPFGRLIRRAGPLRALTVGLGLAGLGMALIVAAPNQGWLLGPMVLYAVGQVAGNSAAGDLLLRIGGGGGRAVGMVRLTSDVGLVVGPAAAGTIADAAGVGAPFPVLATLTGVAAIAVWRAASRPRPNLPNPPPNMGGGAGA